MPKYRIEYSNHPSFTYDLKGDTEAYDLFSEIYHDYLICLPGVGKPKCLVKIFDGTEIEIYSRIFGYVHNILDTTLPD